MTDREPTTHQLKTWQPDFDAIASGEKTYDLRRADRDFAPGDLVVFREYYPGTDEYGGREVRVRLTHVTRADDTPWGAAALVSGFCVLGFRLEGD